MIAYDLLKRIYSFLCVAYVVDYGNRKHANKTSMLFVKLVFRFDKSTTLGQEVDNQKR